MIKLGNHRQLLISYYILKTKRIFCMKQNHVKLEIFILKKNFQEKLYQLEKESGMKSSGYGKKRVSLL